jgi:D-tagatose-1,6-bisphosphate aldolase subunit GatZ/KbaZ
MKAETSFEARSFLQDFGPARSRGESPGVYSVCSSHAWVLEAAMRHALGVGGPLLIEATCNQANQFGGYTGMTAADFRCLVESIASRVGFPAGQFVLGGDHLGPYPWQTLTAEKAMENAVEMVRNYVRAGFVKIHLDASMPCMGDPTPLPEETIAERAATLACAAESSVAGAEPVYVIGTEVPTPGGAVDDLETSVTQPAMAGQAIESHRRAFHRVGLESAWDRVIALVVQPGVEFGHEKVLDYDAKKAASLSRFLASQSSLVFEAHSTDYQRPNALRELVRDGFAILKVGPALTFAMRQAIFALAHIEEECFAGRDCSGLLRALRKTMLEQPKHWQKHYSIDPRQATFREFERLLFYSYSDRIRYYWSDPVVRAALEKLIGNLDERALPETLVAEFLPRQYCKVRAGRLECRPLALIFDRIGEELAPYSAACREG